MASTSPTDDSFFTSALPTRAQTTAGPSPLDDNFFTSAIPQASQAPSTAASASAAGPGAGLGSRLGRYALQGADAFERGLLGVAGLPGDAEAVASRYLSPKFGNYLPTSADINNAMTEVEQNPKLPGALAPGYLAPQTAGERYLTAGARGLGSAVPALGLGLGLPAAAGQGLGAGLAGQAGKDVAGTPGEIAGSVMGGGLTQGVMSALGRKGLNTIAGQLGDSSSLQQAGQALHTQLGDFVDNVHPAWQKQIWAPVDAKIDPKLPVPLPNYKQALDDLSSKTGVLQGQSDILTPSKIKALQDNFNASQSSGRFSSAPPTWADASQFRSNIGDAMSNPKLLGDVSDKQMARLYAGLSQDMRTAAHGVGAGEDFDNANEQSKVLFSLLDKNSPTGKVVNNAVLDKVTPESTAKTLLGSAGAKSGSTVLDNLRTIAPESVDELAAAHLRDPGVMFHKFPEASQQALIPDETLRQQAVRASQAATGSSTKDAIASPLHALVGETAGEGLTTIAGHLAGIPANSFLPPEVGKLLGLTAPYAYKAVKGALTNPGRLQGLGLGLGSALANQPGKASQP